MFSKHLTAGLLAVTLLPLLSCKKDNAALSNACYTGQVVAVTCENGVLIDVDSRFPIGGATSRNGTNGPVPLGKNVIIVSNSRDIASIGANNNLGPLDMVGRRLYFSAEPDSLMPGLGCYVLDGVLNPVPRMRLSNVSTTACVPIWQ